jgi:hypothetical protein
MSYRRKREKDIEGFMGRERKDKDVQKKGKKGKERKKRKKERKIDR